MRKLFSAVVGLGAVALVPAAASAAEGGQSPYQKGYTDSLAGVLPPFPGVYMRNDVIYYSGSADASVLGGRVVAGIDVESVANASAFSIVTENKVLGGQYALAFALPLANADITATVTGPRGNTFGQSDDTFGVGDVILSPVILGWHNGKVHSNVNVSVYLPTGEYTAGALANLSKNYPSLQFQGAVTWMDPASGWAVSGTATYLFNAENQTTDYKTGQILHFDGAVTKAFGEWRLGAVGYAMIQTTGDSGAGARLGDFKSEVYGAGPFVSYDAKFGERPVTLLLKWYHEFGAKNTFEGDTVTAAFAFKF
jgi:hypothetical protein